MFGIECLFFYRSRQGVIGCSTCPQCLDSGVSSIQPIYFYTDASTNQMHYAWQAGVGRSCLDTRPYGINTIYG
jgi:hypothetical protein